MGALKDIVDLCILLRNEIKDGKVDQAVGQIQSLTLALQSEQSAIVEKNVDLMHENLALKQQILDLRTSLADTERKLIDREKNILSGYEFNQETGLWYEKGKPKTQFFCGACAATGKLVPVKNQPQGWRCVGCNHYFGDPRRPDPAPKVYRMGSGF